VTGSPEWVCPRSSQPNAAVERLAIHVINHRIISRSFSRIGNCLDCRIALELTVVQLGSHSLRSPAAASR
ncbi:MAG TPA: hypothetical protein VE422_37680, partial [Terriglobia bacterium]|nr:hypothetical protein [Terriglobia bacterium]